MSELRRFRFEHDAGHFAGIEFGNPALDLGAVLLHANGFNAMTYQSVLAPLGVRARVGGLDQRGHGLSTVPADPTKLTGWSVFRDDAIAFLEQKAPKGTVLCGHSLGATTALLVAAKRPDLVKALLLVDPVILPKSLYRTVYLVPGSVGWMRTRHTLARTARKRKTEFESREAALEHFSGRGSFASWREPFLADYLFDGLAETDTGTVRLTCDPAWEAAVFGAQRHRPWQALRKAPQNITILRGAERSTVSDAVAKRILEKRPLTVIETVRGSSHFLPMEVPYAMREKLSELISQHIEGFQPGEEGPVKRSLSGTI